MVLEAIEQQRASAALSKQPTKYFATLRIQGLRAVVRLCCTACRCCCRHFESRPLQESRDHRTDRAGHAHALCVLGIWLPATEHSHWKLPARTRCECDESCLWCRSICNFVLAHCVKSRASPVSSSSNSNWHSQSQLKHEVFAATTSSTPVN